MLNDPNQPSEARRPRGVVKVGGVIFNGDGSASVTTAPMPLPGWIEWDVHNNGFYQADRFSVSFAVNALPTDHKEDWFAQQQEINVEIFAGFPADPENYDASQLQSLIYGMVDEVEYDPVARVIHLSGRDMTAKMIDAKTTAVYVNRKSSDIATMIATKYGLNPKVTPTAKMAGKYYELVHAHLHHQRSEWDLLCFLAQMEQFSVYVSGHDLHFEPLPVDTAEPYVLQWQSNPFTFNGTHLRFMRSLTLAKGAQVTVQSFSQKTGKVINQVYPTGAASNAQKYIYRFANLNAEQALQKAQALHKEITLHEVKLSAEMPADNILTAQNTLQVVGTGTVYDQKYFPDEIRRSMSMDRGYTMSVSAKNHSPQTQVTM
jgi:phage protein D